MRVRRGAGGVVHVRGCARARFGLPLESVRVQVPSDQVDLGPCRFVRTRSRPGAAPTRARHCTRTRCGRSVVCGFWVKSGLVGAAVR